MTDHNDTLWDAAVKRSAGECLIKKVDSDLELDSQFANQCRSFSALDEMKRGLEDLVKRIELSKSEIAGRVLDGMAEFGVKNVSMTNGLTIQVNNKKSIKKKSEKSGVTSQMVCDALTRMGRGDMVEDGYSASSLSSLVTEAISEEGDVPSELKDLVDVVDIVRVGTTKH